MTPEPKPHVYVPEDKDDLRDGLYRGFYAHLTPPQAPPEKKP